MAVRIGHASISEKGTVNGSKGDQTNKEVCIREWYPNSWGCVLRAKDTTVAEKMAEQCEDACNNNKIGYGQGDRNSAHTEAKKVGYLLKNINNLCNVDCSSLMALCAIAAGIIELEYTVNAPTTSTMKSVFSKTGKFDVLLDSKYLTSDKYLKRGDILVRAGKHTVMVLDNGSMVAPVSTPVSTPVVVSGNYGIDVSKYQGTIDWNKVKSSGKSFAILKVTKKDNGVEESFERNYIGSSNAGLNIGGYRYVYATNVSDAQKEAKAIVNILKGRKLNIGVWLDMEDSSISKLSKSTLSSIINAEAKILTDAGYSVGIYCNKNWYDNVLDGKTLAKVYPFWIARYPTNDTGVVVDSLSPKSFAKAWQYSSKGKVAGISGNVDMNVAFVDLVELMKSPNKVTTTVVSTNTVSYYSKYTGKSSKLDEVLIAIGVPSQYIGSVAKRKTVATKNGISNYSGTAAQNVSLINLAKQGKLKKV